jgi:hypothetical protein
MAGARIQLKRATAAAWTAANTVLFAGEIGLETDTNKFKIGNGSTAFNSLPYFNGNLTGSNLNDLSDVVITSATDGDFLRWNGSQWINDAVNLSTDTIGSYVESLVAGTGVTLTNNSGEGATPTVAIGQSVATSASVEFAALVINGQTQVGGHILPDTTEEYDLGSASVRFRDIYLSGTSINLGGAEITSDGTAISFPGGLTGDVSGNADTASALQTSRIIELSGDLSGSVSFDGSSSVSINATIQPNSVALGADTTGNYLVDLSQGTGVTVTHTPGEGSTASIAIGQDVATSASVSFAKVTTTGDVVVGGDLTVNGTTTTLNTENLLVEDNIIVLNSNVSGSPSVNAGIEIERGDSANVVLRWNESSDSWEVTEDGSVYKNIATGQDVETTASVSFAAVTASTFTGPLVGNASTAAALQTARTISLGGDLSGSASFNGTSDITISASVVNSGVSLDEISDVVITSPLQFQGLMYDGTNWVNSNIPDVYLVRNNTGSTILKGTLVGAVGAEPSGRIDVAPFEVTGTENSELRAMGIVTSNISSGVNGAVMSFGTLTGLDTRGDTASALAVGDETWAAGDILFAHPTVDGKLTNVRPQHDLAVAFITVRHASTGQIAIRIIPGNNHLEWMHDVSLVDKTSGDFLKYNGTLWVNDPINLGTDTVGNYLVDLSQGTGVTVSHTPGEGSTASISIGQSVATTDSPTFAGLTINGASIVLEGSTADDYETTLTVTDPTADRTITFPNASGTVALNGSIALTTDTTGDYVASLVEGTGLTISNNSGEGATPTISIGQSVATNASVEFYHIAMTGPVDASNTVATKQYVDQVAAGIDWHESVTLGSAVALPNTPTYDNGTSGSGATLTAGANARLIVDGSNAVTGTRILVKNQADATQNGVYDVTEQGSVSVPWVLTRAEDFDGDTGHEVYGGEAVFVTGGTVNIRQGFTVTSTGSGTEGAHEFGTDNVTFTQFTGTAAFVVGDGLAQNGNEISVGVISSDRIVLSSHAIDLATVSQTNTSGTAGISFVQSHSIDSYGRVTGTVTADVADASTSQKGIAQFNSEHFTISSGSVSIGQAVGTSSSVTFAAVTAPLIGNVTGNVIGNVTGDVTGSASTASQLATPRAISLTGDVTGSVSFSGSADASITATIAANSVSLGTDTTGNYVSGVSQGTGVTVSHTPSEGSTATISIGQDVATSANPTFNTINITNSASVNGGLLRTSVSGSTVSLNMKGPSSMSDMFNVGYTQAAMFGNDTALISLRDFAGVNAVAAIRLSQASGNEGVDIGPRIAIDSASPVSAGFTPFGSSSVVLFVNQHSGASVGFAIKDHTNSTANMFEARASSAASSSVAVSIGNYGDSYRFFANSASLSSASIQTLTVGGNLIVNGTTTTINSTTVTIDDPIFTLGGDTAPASDDNKDRGIEFRYHSGTAASVGFMGYDDSSQMFTFLVGATNSSEVFSGTAASVNVGMIYIGGAQIAASNLSNGVTGSGSVVLASNPAISNAAIQSSAGNLTTISGSVSVSGSMSFGTASVSFGSSASVTLPAKTFFPEEYLAVSSSVTLNSTTHRYATLEMTASAGTSVISVPTDASDNFPVGTVIQIIRAAAGEVQVTAVTPGTTTVNNALGTRLRAQWSTATLRKRAANTWLLSGDLKV